MAFKNFPVKGRGTKGMLYLKPGEKIGSAVAIQTVQPDDDVIIICQSGQIIRVPVKEISIQGRNTQGVRIVTLHENDSIQDVAILKGDI
jgi:DNA gyrase subunit A